MQPALNDQSPVERAHDALVDYLYSEDSRKFLDVYRTIMEIDGKKGIVIGEYDPSARAKGWHYESGHVIFGDTTIVCMGSPSDKFEQVYCRMCEEGRFQGGNGLHERLISYDSNSRALVKMLLHKNLVKHDTLQPPRVWTQLAKYEDVGGKKYEVMYSIDDVRSGKEGIWQVTLTPFQLAEIYPLLAKQFEDMAGKNNPLDSKKVSRLQTLKERLNGLMKQSFYEERDHPSFFMSKR
jgi:hypothetical protein